MESLTVKSHKHKEVAVLLISVPKTVTSTVTKALGKFILHLVEQVRITKYTELFWPKLYPWVDNMDSSVKEMAITNINGKIQEIAKSAIIILEKISRLIERADLDSPLSFHFFLLRIMQNRYQNVGRSYLWSSTRQSRQLIGKVLQQPSYQNLLWMSGHCRYTYPKLESHHIMHRNS